MASVIIKFHTRFQDFASLQNAFPDEAKTLHGRLEQEINQRYKTLKDMADKPFLEKNDKKAA